MTLTFVNRWSAGLCMETVLTLQMLGFVSLSVSEPVPGNKSLCYMHLHCFNCVSLENPGSYRRLMCTHTSAAPYFCDSRDRFRGRQFFCQARSVRAVDNT